MSVLVLLQGAYAGGAAGFQLQSLLSLQDLRSNGGRLSLLHFIVAVSASLTLLRVVASHLSDKSKAYT